MKENSYRTLEKQLTDAARELFPDADYVYVVDFTDKEVTIATNTESAQVCAYEKQADKIILNNGELATNEESKSWFAQFAEHLSNLFSLNEKIKANKSEDDPMPLTKEERAELVKEINEGLSANIANAVAEALKPVQASVEELQTNQEELQTNQKAIKEEIAANANKEVAEKRAAVAKVHGEIVANALSGEALEAMFKSLGKATPLAANTASEDKKGEVPDFNTYF